MASDCLSRPEPHAMASFTVHDLPVASKSIRSKLSSRKSTPSLQLDYESLPNQWMLPSEVTSPNQSDDSVYCQIIPFITQPLVDASTKRLNKLRFKLDVEHGEWALNTALELGVGSGGSVSLASSKAILGTQRSVSSHVAIKRFDGKELLETDVDFIKRNADEIYISCMMDHENIIQVYGSFLYNQQFHLVMEYCPTDFFKLIMANSITKPEIDNYFIQMIKGVHYLHNQGIAHRDLKIENFMISEQGVLKIIDFGFATLERPSQGLWGSDPYMAPEIFSGNYYDPEKADVWSLAIIYYSCINKRFPWDAAIDEDPLYPLFLADPTTISKHLPSSSRTLILKMLSVNPKVRPTVNEVKSDPWFLKTITKN